jgi:hypothetical protein
MNPEYSGTWRKHLYPVVQLTKKERSTDTPSDIRYRYMQIVRMIYFLSKQTSELHQKFPSCHLAIHAVLLNFDHNKWQTNSDLGTLVSQHIISYSALPVIGISLFFTFYFLSERSGRTVCPVYNTSVARSSPCRPWVPPAMQTTLNYAPHATQNIDRNALPPYGSRVHEGALMGHIVSHINLIHNLHILRTHSNIILNIHLRLHVTPSLQVLGLNICMCFLFLTRYMMPCLVQADTRAEMVWYPHRGSQRCVN